MGDEAERAVPRDDGADGAHRLAHEQPEAGHRWLRGLLPRKRVGQRRVLLEPGLRTPRAVLGDLVDRSRLARPRVGDGVGAFHDRVPEGPEVLRALPVGEAGPRSVVERGTGRGHGSRHVVGLGLGDAEVERLGS